MIFWPRSPKFSCSSHFPRVALPLLNLPLMRTTGARSGCDAQTSWISQVLASNDLAIVRGKRGAHVDGHPVPYEARGNSATAAARGLLFLGILVRLDRWCNDRLNSPPANGTGCSVGA